MIVAFALPIIFSLVRMQDGEERSVATPVESRDQGFRVQAKITPKASTSDGHDLSALSTGAFDLPSFDYRSC
jgi:hypothetical protein